MDDLGTETVEDFSRRLSTWLDENLDPRWADKYPPSSQEWITYQKEWDRKLYAGGWAGVFWPPEFGGLDVGIAERAAFARIMAERGAPEGFGKIGKRLIGPAIMKFGTPEQQERFLGPILRGEEFWCQGFSEPEAGSDLAGLRTKAVRTDGGWTVHGQKIWTSHAASCDWIFLLARTGSDEVKQRGISMLLSPIDADGIEMRPIHQINGGHDFNEVFFDGLFIPDDMIVGKENEGWTVAKALLSHERGLEMAFGALATARAALDRLIEIVNTTDDATAAAEVGLLEARCLGTESNAMRLAEAQLRAQDPSDLSSVLRIQSTETFQAAAEAAILRAPLGGITTDDERAARVVTEYLTSRGATIAGGTSEIQLNIIAKRLLQMA